MVAQPERALDREVLLADGDAAGRGHVLLGVAAGEGRLGVLLDHVVALLGLGLAAPRRADRPDPEVERAVDPGVVGERLPGVLHLGGLVEQEHGAVVGDAVLDVGLDDLEPQPAGVVGGVALDLRPPEHERHLPGRQVEAGRHLRVALVGAVAHAHPAPEPGRRVEEVVVAALVEVGRLLERVEEVVLRLAADAHAS